MTTSNAVPADRADLPGLPAGAPRHGWRTRRKALLRRRRLERRSPPRRTRCGPAGRTPSSATRTPWSNHVLPALTAGKTISVAAGPGRRRSTTRPRPSDTQVVYPMTVLQSEHGTAARSHGRRRARRARRRRRGRAGYLFVAGYTVLLLAFGVVPTGYALYLALTNSSGQFTGFGQFTKVTSRLPVRSRRSRTSPSTSVMWLRLCSSHRRRPRARAAQPGAAGRRSVSRFLFYLPGALAGVASVLVWLFMLDPSVSPVAWLLHGLRLRHLRPGSRTRHLPVILGADRVLDRGRRLDRGHVRRAQQHPGRASSRRPGSTGPARGRRPGTSRSR